MLKKNFLILSSGITSKFLSVPVLSTSLARNLSFRKVANWYATLGPKRNPNPPYSHITQIGDPILRRKADPVPLENIKTDEIQNLIKKLVLLLKKYNCAGLSAPQIGIPLRIFVMEFGENRVKEFSQEVFNARKMSTFPLTILVNPEMKIVNYTKITYPEACGSFRGYSADVPRYSEVEIKGYNEKAESTNITADGWTARIIQHEMDHLDGKMYTDVMDRKTLTCTCWQEINKNAGKVEIPFY